MFIFFSITLRESFSQCLLFNESKLANSYYNHAIEFNNAYYMVGAGTLDNNENNYHSDFSAMVVKSDKCGNTLWRNYYDNKQGYFYNNTIYKAIGSDGYLYLLGGTQENARAGTTFVAKINEEGRLIWYKIFHPDENDITSSNFFIDNNQLVIYGNHEDKSKVPLQLKMFLMVFGYKRRINKTKRI